MVSRLILILGTCLVVYHTKNVATDDREEILSELGHLGRLKGTTTAYYEYEDLDAYEDVMGYEERNIPQPKG